MMMTDLPELLAEVCKDMKPSRDKERCLRIPLTWVKGFKGFGVLGSGV